MSLFKDMLVFYVECFKHFILSDYYVAFFGVAVVVCVILLFRAFMSFNNAHIF